MPAGDIMEPLFEPHHTVWPFPFTAQDWAQQIPPDLVVKFYPVDILEVIRDLIRRPNVVQRLCSNRKSRGELLATSPTHWFTTKLDGMWMIQSPIRSRRTDHMLTRTASCQSFMT